MQLYMLQVIFQMNNFDVTVAQNGHEAYEEVVNSFRQSHDKNALDKDQQLFDLIILDLNMPISDGYQACKNIVNLYSDSNKIFKTTSNQDQEDSLGQVLNDQIDLQSKLPWKDQMPIIVAVTSEILNDELLHALSELGFFTAYEAPIKDAIIKSQIIPKLQERRLELHEKFQLMHVMQGSIDIIDKESHYESSPKNQSPLMKSMSMLHIQGTFKNKPLKSNNDLNSIRKRSSLQFVHGQQQQQVKKRISFKQNYDNSAEIKQEQKLMTTPSFNCDDRPLLSLQVKSSPVLNQSIEAYRNSSSFEFENKCLNLPRFAQAEEEIKDMGLYSLRQEEMEHSQSVSSAQASSFRDLFLQTLQPSNRPNVLPDQFVIQQSIESSIKASGISQYESEHSQIDYQQIDFDGNPLENNSQQESHVNRMASFGHNQSRLSQQRSNNDTGQQDASPPQIVVQEPAQNLQVFERSDRSDSRRNSQV